MNGGDHIGTYIPLFSQAKGAEITVYVVTYYILLGVWCLIAFLAMKQKLVRLAQKYADAVVPFLYVGLSVYVVVKSECYPWPFERIDNSASKLPGRTVMALVTKFLFLICILGML
jgi:cadmium resistance protein CadD (predicted permease)